MAIFPFGYFLSRAGRWCQWLKIIVVHLPTVRPASPIIEPQYSITYHQVTSSNLPWPWFWMAGIGSLITALATNTMIQIIQCTDNPRKLQQMRPPISIVFKCATDVYQSSPVVSFPQALPASIFPKCVVPISTAVKDRRSILPYDQQI